jgi:Domain of unknown function (DUF4388)
MVASHNVPAGAADVPPESVRGFAIQLPSAQLGDLIQINCLNRIRGAFRVSSSQGEGHLFFDGGLLVHAAYGEHVGLDAVVIMLGWRGGSIEPCALGWPAQSSIGMGADALLLRAAQRLDERTRNDERNRDDATTKVVRRVPWPEELAPTPEASTPEPTTAPTPTPIALDERRSEHSGLALKSALAFDGLSRLEVTRVDAYGNIQSSKPGAATELADTAFYCQRLASLVGEGLGLGPCRALACENAKEGVVVFQGRSIVGVRGRRQDLALVLAKVGLG